ncbi:MAG: putative 2-dehydropantoate 2-reductase [Firmicutes bacterium]|nr:putative 2-dehydropantoate 2-reductase [Bacillota bacterium]
MKNIVIIGLGALGCAYASKLYLMNPNGLKVIAGGERAKRYQEEGVLINGKRFDFTYVSPQEKCEPADLIVVAVKGYQLAQAVIDMKNHVGNNTIILPLLNGITSEEIIGKEYGMDKLLYAVSFGLTANREGNHIHFTSYGNLAFGEKINLEYSEKVQGVKAIFERAGIPFTIPENMMHSIWWKFMVNVGINQCSAVTGGRYRVFQTVNEAKSLMESAMWEVVRISEKAGIHLNGADIEKWYEILNTLNPDSRTSMLEDIECGRKTEVDMFAATVCEMGEKYGVETPINRTLLNIIKVLEGR